MRPASARQTCSSSPPSASQASRAAPSAPPASRPGAAPVRCPGSWRAAAPTSRCALRRPPARALLARTAASGCASHRAARSPRPRSPTSQRAGSVVGAQAEQHALRLRVVVRRALAVEVGQEERRARRAAPASASRRWASSAASLGAQQLARPSADALAADEHHRHLVPACRAARGRRRARRAPGWAGSGRWRRRSRPRCRARRSPARARTAPMPTALAALSPPPPATSDARPAGPSAAPARARSRPRRALPSTRRGMCDSVEPAGGQQLG